MGGRMLVTMRCLEQDGVEITLDPVTALCYSATGCGAAGAENLVTVPCFLYLRAQYDELQIPG